MHPKIDEADIKANGKLLADEQIAEIAKIERYLAEIREQTQPIEAQKQEQEALREQVMDDITIYDDPREAINSRIFNILQSFRSRDKEVEAFKMALISNLNEFASHHDSVEIASYILDLNDAIQQAEGAEIYDINDLLVGESIDDVYESHATNFPVTSAIEELEAVEMAHREKIDELERQLDEIKKSVITDSAEQGWGLEYDEKYQLTKLSRKTNPAFDFSVIKINQPETDTNTPFALYRGKDRMLGEGGFGTVKLCQNLDTGEWCAIKIQGSIMKQPTQAENAVLDRFEMFKGELLRDRKYYSAQTLLPGNNLQHYLTSLGDTEALELRLALTQQALNLVKDFHQHYIHRDIKLENFVYDPVKKQLYLCDFGMAVELNADGNYHDLSGSGTILAPEVDDQFHPGRVNYSVKSDIYSLGKTIEELFEGCESPDVISEIVESMTQDEPAMRAGNLQTISDTVKAEISRAHHASTSLPSS